MRRMVMSMFDNGVSYYTRWRTVVDVAFPEDCVRCQWCRFLRADKANDRHWCALTDDILYSIKRVGDCCPLEIEEVNCE